MTDRKAAGAKASQTRKRQARLERKRRQAKDAFLTAAYALTDPMVDDSEALLLGALGLFRLVESDPDERLLDRAESILGEIRKAANP